MGFWKEFAKSNSDIVHSPTIIMAFVGAVLATPIVVFSLNAAYYHIFTLHKGLDGPSVNLLLGLLGAATGGLGTTAYFSKTTMSQVTSVGGMGGGPISGPPPTAKKAPPIGDGL
jgi:uncharacterized membrane protein YeaQ/YmgE (transglycosylase-associated protein family)